MGLGYCNPEIESILRNARKAYRQLDEITQELRDKANALDEVQMKLSKDAVAHCRAHGLLEIDETAAEYVVDDWYGDADMEYMFKEHHPRPPKAPKKKKQPK